MIQLLLWLIPVVLLGSAGLAGSGSVESGVLSQLGRQRYGPGVCGPADPTYIRTATETGGQPFFLSPAEVGNSAAIMGASFLQSELMLWASGVGEQAYSVPVDSSIERATFSVSFDSKGGTLTVVSPDGSIAQQGERIEDITLNCVRHITVTGPAVGVWQLKVIPTGRFWLVARSKSELSLMTAEFVRPGGRPGHEGLFRVQGQPIAGRPATLRVRLSSDVKSATFGLVSLDAHPLLDLDLKPVGDEEFVGAVNLPNEPFRVVVTGLTPAGVPYQRVFATLFHAEVVEVLPPAGEIIVAGIDNLVTFTVRNLGPAVRLRLVAIDNRGGILAVEPVTLEVEQSGQASATVRLAVPSDAPAESRVTITLTASTEAAVPRWNSATKEFAVTRR